MSENQDSLFLSMIFYTYVRFFILMRLHFCVRNVDIYPVRCLDFLTFRPAIQQNEYLRKRQISGTMPDIFLYFCARI